jgi:hypothetical protein
MREFSTNLASVLFNSDNITYFYLIKLSFSSTYYLTSYATDLDFDGQTYTADSGILDIEAPKFNKVVDRESYNVVLSDIGGTMLTEFRNNVVGKDIEVRLGFLDANGDPMLSTADVKLIYKGFVDSPSINNDFEGITASIEGTSPMADLDTVNNFISSKDGMDQKSSTDTTFDSIYKDNEIKLKWGKI